MVLPRWYSGPQYFFGSVPRANVFVRMIGHVSTAIRPVVGSMSNVIVPSRRLSGITGGRRGDGNDGATDGSSIGGGSNSGVGDGSSAGVASSIAPSVTS